MALFEKNPDSRGHLEQIASHSSTHFSPIEVPSLGLPPQIFCKIVDVQLLANKDNDEVFTKLALLPLPEGDLREDEEDGGGVTPTRSTPQMFCKTLTASDTSTHGGFSVPRRAAEDCFPPPKIFTLWKIAAVVGARTRGFQKLFFGQEEIAIPVHSTIEAACAAHPTADVFINFASFRSAAASSKLALKQPTIRVVAIIAEGVPESDTKELISYARSNNKVVIGPATVGGIQAGAFKIGDTVGTTDNIIQCKLYRPGSVGLVSKSGGMSNELYNTIARVTDGLYEGDVFPGSTLSDHVLRFNNIPQIKMIVVLGELGGRDEYSLVEALKSGKINKPVCAWVSGTCATLFKSEVQFGHAGAKSGGEMESAQAKNQALKDAGAVVPTSFESFETSIKETYEKLAEEGKIAPVKEITPPQIPDDLNSAIKSGKVRAPTHNSHRKGGKRSSLVSRFRFANNRPTFWWRYAYDRNLTPYEFVESMKKKGIRVPGIGHRYIRDQNVTKISIRTNIMWEQVRVPKQPGNTECGY
ncbi:hypothetical protein LXL04_019247 [Taraxacum kok-saghyz]